MNRLKSRRRARARQAGPAVVIALAAALLGGCSLVGRPEALSQYVPPDMTVNSPVFGPGEIIPRQYTCYGRGESPPIYWTGVPQGSKSIALVVDDSDAPITPYVYWIAFDISPARSYIQAGRLPSGARLAVNSSGSTKYDPPCPKAHSHQYRFTVYALNSVLALPNGAGLEAAWAAIAQHAIARGRLTATARRPTPATSPRHS